MGAILEFNALETSPQAPEAEPTIQISDYYTPFPRQQEFHDCRAKYRLFGGAAGPGKTKALLWEGISQAVATNNVDTLLLRRTFPELESSLITYFRRDVPRDLYRSYDEAKHVITWHNGSTTRFGYSAGENDVYQYQGAEFLFIGVDELTLFTLGQWQFLTSRNRCAVPGTTPNMAAATNPGNIGHAWVKALWVDQRPAPGMDRPGQYDPADYAFIRATIADNPLYRDDAGYLKTLDALPRHMRQAFLEGDWNVFAGQYFDLFDVRRHTARAEQLGLEAWWPRWISIDWGYEHPSAVYWHTARPDGVIITYRELVQNHLSPKMLAMAIVERGRPEEKFAEVSLSPDAFAHHTSDLTIADQLGEVLAEKRLPRPIPADDDRVGGWMLIYQMLQDDRWLIADSCPRLIECLPTLVRDPANVEDVQKMAGDDAADSARYGLVAARAGTGAYRAEGSRARERRRPDFAGDLDTEAPGGGAPSGARAGIAASPLTVDAALNSLRPEARRDPDAHEDDVRQMTFNNITDWLLGIRQGLRSRYVRMLEAQLARERGEIERLRLENRALLNSLLGTAGVPPVEAPPAHPAQIAPIRRRSWTQIAASREIEAAREARAREREDQQRDPSASTFHTRSG